MFDGSRKSAGKPSRMKNTGAVLGEPGAVMSMFSSPGGLSASWSSEPMRSNWL